MASFTIIIYLLYILMICNINTSVVRSSIVEHNGIAWGQETRKTASENQLSSSVSLKLVAKVVAALDSALNYYENHYTSMNQAGVFGAKVTEGQMNLIVAEYNKGFLSEIVDGVLKKELVSIATRAGRVVKLALPHLSKKYPEYMQKMRRLFQLSWDVGHSHLAVDSTLLWGDVVRTEALSHRMRDGESDDCISELVEAKRGLTCHMGEGCLRAMTRAGGRAHHLTSQVLYTVVAEMSGCGSRFEKWLVKHGRSDSIEQLQGELCSNLLSEARQLTLVQNAANITANKDLLMEMEYTCGMLGYVEFLPQQWLLDILAWQHPTGCFAASGAHVSVGRKLLTDQTLPDGCLQHLTTVAVSALAVHLHYLVYTGRRDTRPVGVVPPPIVLHPPPPSFGSGLDNTLYRQDLYEGINRIAEKEITLEDKADLLMKDIEDRLNSSISSSSSSSSSSRQQGVLVMAGQQYRSSAVPAPAPQPWAHHHAPTANPIASQQTSMATIYFVVASIVLVMILILKYVQGGRRFYGVLKNRFRY